MKKFYTLLTLLCLIASGASAKGIKTNYRNALVLAYSQANSVFEDDNIKVEIYDEQLWVSNKTNKTIFIDLSQCFYFHNGSSTPFISTGENDKKAKKDDKKASKSGLSTKDDMYLSIAPTIGNDQKETSIAIMSRYVFGTYSTTESPSSDFTDYHKRLLNLIEELVTESQKADPKEKECLGTVSRHLTEDESISNIGASIAYAFNKNAQEWTNVSLTTWVSDVIFTPYYVELPQDLTKKEKRGFGIKETAPAIVHLRANSPFEFEEDKSPIIVCDWTGNYKKGTFELNSTRISKTKGPSFLQIVGAAFTYGATLISSFRETFYKSNTHFDGLESDWGEMNYAGVITQTKQE